MSYIRSTSNPESLYIFGNGKDCEIIQGSNHLGYIPTKIFDGLIQKYHKNFQSLPCQFRKCKVEDFVLDGLFKIKVTFKEIEIIMWDVTWDSIVYNNLSR